MEWMKGLAEATRREGLSIVAYIVYVAFPTLIGGRIGYALGKCYDKGKYYINYIKEVK